MTFSLPRMSLIFLVSLGWAFTALTREAKGAPVPSPAPPRASDVDVSGEALNVCFPRLSRGFGVRLVPSRDLATQRLVAYGRNVSLAIFQNGIKELLSAPPDARVMWGHVSGTQTWHLEQSQARRGLISRLTNYDLDVYGKHLDQQVKWGREQDPSQIKSMPAVQQPSYKRQLAGASLVGSLGEAERTRLFRGEPQAISVSALPTNGHGQVVREWLSENHWLNNSPVNPEGCNLVLSLERNRFDPDDNVIVASLVLPDGSVPFAETMLRHQHRRPGPDYLGIQFSANRVPRASPQQPDDRRVTVQLTSDPSAKPDAMVTRTFAQLLRSIADAGGITVFADGYLRAPARLPANLELRDYSLRAILDTLCFNWDCEWRFTDAQHQVVVVRSKAWWLEDAADVEDATLADVRARIGGADLPELEDLSMLLELRDAQIDKLIQLHICNGVSGIVPPSADGTGVRQCLRFYFHLSSAQQTAARSEEGLLLKQVDPELVRRWLGSTLAVSGFLTPERREQCLFRMQETSLPATSGRARSYHLALMVRGGRGPGWHHDFSLGKARASEPAASPK